MRGFLIYVKKDPTPNPFPMGRGISSKENYIVDIEELTSESHTKWLCN